MNEVADPVPDVATERVEAPSFLERLRQDPNPVWLREMRQSARLSRTPVVLATVTTVTALVICAVGGVASTTAAPSEVGVAVFHTFFSLAFAVVSWLGPGVAAITIASERSGRTWEPLLLTGLSVRRIARGKFLSALTYIGLYLVMLAPVGALPFLFGGITALEVLAAFVLLALFAALAVGFGLSVSSALSSPGLAAIVVLPIAVFLSLSAYMSLGVGLSFVAHELWPSVVSGAPVWLPTAYARAEFGLEYVVYLVVIPLGSIALLAWFFYENTIANMLGPSDDRVFGLKRWYSVACPLFTFMGIGTIGLVPDDHAIAGVIVLCVMFALSVLAQFLFAGDALEPSPKVRGQYERTAASSMRRLLGPGVVRTQIFVLCLSLASLSILAFAGAAFEIASGTPRGDEKVGAVLIVAGYSAAFLVFLSGLATYVRAHAPNGTLPRLLLLLSFVVAMIGPWLALGMAGVFQAGLDDLLFIAAPSPTYAFAMIGSLSSPGVGSGIVLQAGAACMLAWVGAGLLLLSLGRRRVARALAAHHELARQFEIRLQAEDAAITGGAPP